MCVEEDGILVFWRSKLSEELESPYLFWFSNPGVPLKAKWTWSVRFILSAWFFFYPRAFLLPSPSECFLPSLLCLSLGSSWLVGAQASGQMQSPASYCAHHCRKWSETQELKSRVTVKEWGITSWENSGKTEAGQGPSLEEQGAGAWVYAFGTVRQWCFKRFGPEDSILSEHRVTPRHLSLLTLFALLWNYGRWPDLEKK